MRHSIVLFQHSKALIRRFHKCIPRSDTINITIFGNMVPTVRMIAMLLKQCQGIDELRLYGTEDSVCNIALDLAQVDTNPRIKAFKGDSRLLKDAIFDSKIVIICGGLPSKSTLTQEQLFEENLAAVRNIVLHCVEYNPHAMILVATPPINSLIPMISEEYKKEGVYDPKKIIGISTLSTIIANSLIGKYLKYNPIHVHCPVIGGDSITTRIPILSQCTPSLDSHPEDDRIALYNTIVNSAKCCLDTKQRESMGPMYLSQAFAISRFVTNLVNAIRGMEGVYECAFVRQTGHINSFLPYMQSIVKLGPGGIAGSFMPRITPWECDRLLKAYITLKHDIHLGASVVNGELLKSRRMQECASCDVHPMSQMFRNEHIGDVMIDFTKKYRNLEIYQ